jgi:hypothetical protein
MTAAIPASNVADNSTTTKLAVVAPVCSGSYHALPLMFMFDIAASISMSLQHSEKSVVSLSDSFHRDFASVLARLCRLRNPKLEGPLSFLAME